MKNPFNKTILNIFVCLLISQATFAQNKNSKEPLLKLDIEINGEKHQVNDGDSIVVNGNIIKVKASNIKSFNFGKLAFDYPKHFAYEFEEDFTVKNWTLDGNDFVIMYFEYRINFKLDTFIDQMIGMFKKENCKVEEKTITLGDETLTGKRILVDLLGSKLTYDIYTIETDDSKSHLIAFQDSKNDDGSDSPEKIETLNLIKETFKVKK